MVRIHLPCGEFFIANSGVKVTRIHPFSGVFFTSFQASGKGLFLAASGEISQQPVPHIATILRRYRVIPPCARTGKREFLLFSGKSASSRRSSRKKRSFEDKVLQTLKKHQESFSAMASTHSGKVSSWSPLESTTGRSLCAFKRSRKESKSLPAWQKFS